jgi:hypothetical protein
MAKQTFTTGQVLTAAQMTSLQETAMGGGPATAKVASYVLVAADAGTTVAMNAAGATTITVNTGLFAAGDTVFIQNLGAGACTVTAGTATVATAGSLILPQNDAGILYFTSASAAIFYDYIQVGAASPLTTKGDLYTYGTSDTRLAVGATNGMVLTVDSVEATGLKWVVPSVASGLTLVKTQTIGSAVTSVTVTDAFSSTYDNYLITINGGVASNSSSLFNFTLGATTAGYSYSGIVMQYTSNTVSGSSQNAGSSMFGGYFSTNALSTEMVLQSPFLSKRTIFSTKTAAAEAANYIGNYIGFLDNNTSYTGFTFTVASGNVTGGTIRVYGYQNT